MGLLTNQEEGCLLREKRREQGLEQGIFRISGEIFATYLTSEGISNSDALTQSLSSAKVDLNPHQVDAASFALRCLNSRRGACEIHGESKRSASAISRTNSSAVTSGSSI
jgi:hypothetical protein